MSRGPIDTTRIRALMTAREMARSGNEDHVRAARSVFALYGIGYCAVEISPALTGRHR